MFAVVLYNERPENPLVLATDYNDVVIEISIGRAAGVVLLASSAIDGRFIVDDVNAEDDLVGTWHVGDLLVGRDAQLRLEFAPSPDTPVGSHIRVDAEVIRSTPSLANQHAHASIVVEAAK